MHGSLIRRCRAAPERPGDPRARLGAARWGFPAPTACGLSPGCLARSAATWVCGQRRRRFLGASFPFFAKDPEPHDVDALASLDVASAQHALAAESEMSGERDDRGVVRL